MKQAIGIFDSGIGGLTVQREIKSLLPYEDTIYLGDTARVPYGTKSQETVNRYSMEDAGFLMKRGVKLLVVACNTASAYALGNLRDRLTVPVVGVIEPGARKAVQVTTRKRVGVIGTEGTIKSMAYVNTIKSMDPEVSVHTQACPLFVPLAEEGWTDNEVAFLSAVTYLHNLKREAVDTVVLGCTHYPLLKGTLRKVMGEDVNLIDSAEETALEVGRVLMERGLKRTERHGPAEHLFYVTDSPDRFTMVGRRFLGDELGEVAQVSLEG